tara:strand:+ start:77 stop:781 length:705 start_codon:yes stop_codon:yes gene_type:complete
MKSGENQNKKSTRMLKVKLKTSKGRKISSTRWLERQLNDPFVQLAKKEGYRSRSAYKIIEIDDKFNFFLPGKKVIDLGCAPGGWSQVASNRTNSSGLKKHLAKGKVYGVDLLEIDPIDGVEFLNLDFSLNSSFEEIRMKIDGKMDVVMSDMAAPSSGHKKTDHLKIMYLCEIAAEFSFNILEKGGIFIAKVLTGGAESELQNKLKSNFSKVKYIKPNSSRSDSSEKFLIALNYK